MYVTAPGRSGWRTRYRFLRDAVAAIEASTHGGTLTFSSGRFLLDEMGGPGLLAVTRAVEIEGAGQEATALVVPATAPATIDAIRYAPAAGGLRSQGFSVRGLSIVAESGRPARHAINIDVSSGGTVRFARQVTIENVWIGMPGAEFGGRAIAVTNATPTVTGPGLFCSRIRECQIFGGIQLVGAGDSISVRDCAISGANCGVEADLVPGATLLLIDGCNITSAGGAVWLKAGTHIVVTRNNIEQMGPFVGGSGNAACVDLDGKATERLALPEVVGNHIGVLAGVTGAAVRAHRCDEPQIERNTYTLMEAGSVGLRRTPSALGVAARNNRIVGGLGVLE